MKVLYISHKPIFPLIDGGTFAMRSLLECLRYQNFSVKHIFIFTNKHRYSPDAYPKELAKQIKPQGVFINTDVKIVKAMPYFFKGGSYNMDRFYSEEMQELIENSIAVEKFDSIILESLFTSMYIDEIRKIFKGKIYVRTHNVESDIWKGLAQGASGIRKCYYRKLAKDIRAKEIPSYNLSDGIISISENDSEQLINEGLKSKIITLPVSVQIKQGYQHNYEQNNFFHLGSMRWKPNVESLKRLIKIHQLIRITLPESTLNIAGSNSQDFFSSDLEKGLNVEGFVRDIPKYCAQQGIMVAPISSGSGVRIKILEMMAMGIPVITTSVGAQGIDHLSSRCLMIANTDLEIVEACIKLANSEKLRKEIGNNGKSYIAERHNIESISKKLLDFISIK